MKHVLVVLLWSLFAVPAGAALSNLLAPVAVVYPFTVNGNADPEAGGRLALLFAARLASEGGITVKPATPGVDRAHFLSAAKAQGADYYVTGYLTPLGDSVSLVGQVVSTYSGIVVWSDSTEIRTYAEATGQVDAMREAILRHAGRTLAALDQPAPSPTSTPAPSSSSKPNEANLSHLFARKSKAAPAPAPASAPTAAASSTSGAGKGAPVASRPLPTPGIAATHPPLPPPPPALGGAQAIVVAVGGAADAADRSYAANALSAAIAKAGLGGTLITSRSTTDVPTHARELCEQNRAASIYGGTLTLQRVTKTFARGTSANFELIRYDCAGGITAREQAQAQASGRSDTTVAIDRAIAKSLDAALHPRAKRG